METFKIGPKDEGKRLDQFMQDKKHWPRSLVMKAIRTKKLKVNGKKEDASFRLSRGDDVVSYVLEEKKNTEPVILYEDENLLAAVKPAGPLILKERKRIPFLQESISASKEKAKRRPSRSTASTSTQKASSSSLRTGPLPMCWKASSVTGK